MVTTIDFITFIISFLIILKTINRIFRGRINIYTILTLIFWLFQFPSLVIDHVVKDSFTVFEDAKNMHSALTDSTVAILYDFIILSILLFFYKKSLKQGYSRLNDLICYMKNLQFGTFTNIILVILMLLPIPGIILAPDPSIYFKWAYTYRYNISFVSELYHDIVMGNLIMLSFFSWVLYSIQKKHNNLFTYIILFFLTWISFKRTILVFGCLSLIFFYFFKGSFSTKPLKTILKAICLLVLCVGYFIYYSINTGKQSDVPFYYTYTLYYSRHYCLKTAIYDQLQGMSMLEYRGQSILFDMFFFIPREYWPDKPNVFTSSFTNYCKDLSYDHMTTTFYYANIWSEFVANFHIIGIFLSLLLICLIIRISERSNSIYAYMFGCLFIIFYLFWGIQPFTMIILSCWYFFLTYGYITKLLKKGCRYPYKKIKS